MSNENPGSPRQVFLCDECDEPIVGSDGYLLKGVLMDAQGKTLVGEGDLELDVKSGIYVNCRKCFVSKMKG